MAKQNQTTEAKSDKKSRPKVRPTVVEERSDDLAGLARLPGGPIAAMGDSTIQAQAARLGDRRLQGAQRRALAAQIGRVQGNRHLQRVMALLRGDGETSAPQSGWPVQRANAADPRLPADRAEALAYASEEKAAIDTALASLSASADPERRNIPDLIAQENLILHPLTPRHDSTVGGPRIRFFPGQRNYSGSVTLPAGATHHLSSILRAVRIRARQHANIDNMLSATQIENRLVQAVTEIAHLLSARPRRLLNAFDAYRARFNSYWNVSPFNSMSAQVDPHLPSGSKGPRSPRAQAIFERIYNEDAALKAAYDANTDGIRERIDTYMGPEGINPLNSPRLQALRAAFFPFPVPVPNSRYPSFLTAIRNAARPLNDEDRETINVSHDWQRLINDHVTDEDKRAEIRDVINPSLTPATGPVPSTGPISPAQQLATFIADLAPDIYYYDGARHNLWLSGTPVQYIGGTQNFEVGASSTVENPGQTLYIRAQISDSTGVLLTSPVRQFPVNQAQMTTRLAMPLNEPAPMPPGGHVLTFQVRLLESDGTTVLQTATETVTVQAGSTYTQADAEQAAQDDDNHLRNTLFPAMIASRGVAPNGEVAANVAQAFQKNRIPVLVLTQRHDSSDYVRRSIGRADPSQVGYFAGVNYTNSFVDVAGAAAFCDGTNVYINRTTDVSTLDRRDDDELITLLIHEAVHCMDYRLDPGSILERYKGEFRAYWMDGRYGPPDQGFCPSSPGSCLDTTYDPDLPPPGPKSERAREIFNLMYGSVTYDFVQPAYDNNTDGFREAVDNYLIPDGINLVVSIRLDDLRDFIESWNGTGYAAFRANVRAYMGIGPAPPNGALTNLEKDQIRSNRAWRELVERNVTNPTRQNEIKADLHIPR